MTALQNLGVILGQAAGHGNCAQRSAGVSAGRLVAEAAVAYDSATMQQLWQQRERIVERVAGIGSVVECIGVQQLRAHLLLPTDPGQAETEFKPFLSLGHWNATGPKFIMFMWGIADDMQLPIAVLHRTSEGRYMDPICMYRAQPPGGMCSDSNMGSFSYIPLLQLLEWIQHSPNWPPFALVEFVPGHCSPFVFGSRSQRAA